MPCRIPKCFRWVGAAVEPRDALSFADRPADRVRRTRRLAVAVGVSRTPSSLSLRFSFSVVAARVEPLDGAVP